MEIKEEEGEEGEKVKKFTIMPLKRGYVLSNITLCTSALQQTLQLILTKNPGNNLLQHTNVTKETMAQHIL
jgi:hypothetical protein